MTPPPPDTTGPHTVDLPSTSPGHPGAVGGEAAGGPGSQSPPATDSEATQPGCEVALTGGGDGPPGDKEEGGNKEGEDDLDSDEEELWRVLTRLNPVFITISK